MYALANGFALAEAEGDDMREKIRLFDEAAKAFLKNSQHIDAIEDSIASYTPGTAEYEQRKEMYKRAAEAKAERERNPPQPTERELERSRQSRETARRSTSKDGARDYIRKQDELVEKHDLPYKFQEPRFHWSNIRIIRIDELINTILSNGVSEALSSEEYPDDGMDTRGIKGGFDHGPIHQNWTWWEGDFMVSRVHYKNIKESSLHGNWHHAGMFIQRSPDGSQDWIDAWPEEVQAVRWTTWALWRLKYKEIRQYWVPGKYIWETERDRVPHFVKRQLGETYFILSPKDNNDNTWYCSKLIWRAYQEEANIDLDPTKGFWVTVDDLVNSGFTEKRNESIAERAQ